MSNWFDSNRAEAPDNDELNTRNYLVVVPFIHSGGGVFFTCVDTLDPLSTFLDTDIRSEESTCLNPDIGTNKFDNITLSERCPEDKEPEESIDVEITTTADDAEVCELRIDFANKFKNNTASSTDLEVKDEDEVTGNNIFFTNKILDIGGKVIDCSYDSKEWG